MGDKACTCGLANMMKEEPGACEKKQSEPAKKDKKPYQKPAFRYERVFETVALACGKTAINIGCGFSKKNS